MNNMINNDEVCQKVCVFVWVDVRSSTPRYANAVMTFITSLLSVYNTLAKVNGGRRDDGGAKPWA